MSLRGEVKKLPLHEAVLLAGGATAIDVVIMLSIVVPLAVLGAVVWFFFKSARRFDTERGKASRRDSDG